MSSSWAQVDKEPGFMGPYICTLGRASRVELAVGSKLESPMASALGGYNGLKERTNPTSRTHLPVVVTKYLSLW
jgi:hypothetical protein